jgi:hypothetical protein
MLSDVGHAEAGVCSLIRGCRIHIRSHPPGKGCVCHRPGLDCMAQGTTSKEEHGRVVSDLGRKLTFLPVFSPDKTLLATHILPPW